MSIVKRVIGNDGNPAPYDIYANVVTIHGSLNITGNTSTIVTTETNITDHVITLNAGLTAANAPNPLGASIVVDRGTSANTAIQWSETNGYWQLTNDGTTYAKISTAGAIPAGGSTTQVQYNNGGSLLGNANFTFNNGNLSVYNTVIGNGNLTTTASSNQDLTLTADGTGHIYILDVLKIAYQSAPTNVASTTQLYANTVGSGNTGLYVVNNNTTDELITKNRALGLGLLMSY